MENSLSTKEFSYFSMAIDAIVFLLYNTVFIWLTTLHNFSSSLLSLFSSLDHNCQSKIHSETTSCDATNQKDSDNSVLELYKSDLETVMQKMGIFHDLSNVKDEKMKFEELSSIFEEREPSLEEVREAFSVFDQNSDGFVDASDLQRIICNLGFKSEVELEECTRMIQAYDENKDGRIDFNEFVKFMETSFC